MMKGLSMTVLAATAMASVEVHPERQAMIETIHSKTSLWKAGVPERFAGQPIKAMRPLLGVKLDSFNATKGTVMYKKQGLTIPESFDSAENWPHCAKTITDIRDQSNCGCCWAFGAAEAASDRLCIATNGSVQVPLSAQSLCFCASSDGCDGGDLFTPWSYIKTNGLPTGGQFNGTGPFGSGYCSDFTLGHCHHHGPQGSDPYPAEGEPGCPQYDSPKCPSACGANAAAPHNDMGSDKYTFDGLITTFADEGSIQEAIMTDGPVESAFIVYEDFANYVGGIYHHVTGELEGGHAIRIVGWGVEDGTKYWKIANSWNPYWGEDGYFRFIRGENHCHMEGQATAPYTGSTWGKK